MLGTDVPKLNLCESYLVQKMQQMVANHINTAGRVYDNIGGALLLTAYVCK